jgi:hypothetical protein
MCKLCYKSNSCVFQKEMVLHTVYILVLFLIRWTAPFSVDSGYFNQKTPKKCSHFKDHGLRAVDCYGLDLVTVPQHLRTDTEVCFFFNLKFGCHVYWCRCLQTWQFLKRVARELATSPWLCNKIIKFLLLTKHNLHILYVMTQNCKLQVLRHKMLGNTGK